MMTHPLHPLILCSIISLLAACGGDSGSSSTTPPTQEPTAVPTELPSLEPTAVPTAEPTVEPGVLTAIDEFGDNPSNLGMHLYVPSDLPNMAPVLLAVHYCTGDGPTFYRNSGYANLADQHGFIVIYPTAERSSKCFDVASSAALARDGGSDPVALRSMVGYVESQYNVDADRIFVAGVSSGAMMTNVMLALYPEVFSAGAAFAGVPYKCFATSGSSEWSTACANGSINKTAQEWGDLVRSANPEYNGPFPRVQLWHGTDDDVLDYTNFEEAIEQWTNVHNLTQIAVATDTLSASLTRTRYGNDGEQALVEAYRMENIGHNLPVDESEAIRFFGLDQ